MQSGGVRELLQWRAIRHEFMFPSSHAEEKKTTPVKRAADTADRRKKPKIKLESDIVAVSEPHAFQFHEYLHHQLGETFLDMVEVDVATWCVAIVLSPCIAPVLMLDQR